MTREEKLAVIDACCAKAEAHKAVCDLIALHALYQRAVEPDAEIEKLWSNREDISYYGISGRQNVIDYYCTYARLIRDKKQEYLAAAWPEFFPSPENDGAGDMIAYSATTPYVTIAGDGCTAQGIWFCVGLFVEPDAQGMPKPFYDQRKLTADFICEEGQWKIWHMDYYFDFQTPLPRQLFIEEQYAGRTAKMYEDGEEPKPGMGPPPSEDDGPKFPPPYFPTKVPGFNPPLVEPYESWDESMRFTLR